MLIKREWATPTVIGAFTLSGFTGIALFFGWKSQTTLTIHQWLGLTFVLGGLAHITTNFLAFKRHFQARLAKVIVAVYVVLTIVAFFPLAPKRPANNPMAQVMEAVQQAPLEDLAKVFKASPETLVQRLSAAGFEAKSTTQSVADVVGPDFEARMKATSALAGGGGPRPPPPPGAPPPKP